jgi:formate hydrogenlyase subunit 3/multisubunit Na+/H+ antiporter MnhD subunit
MALSDFLVPIGALFALSILAIATGRWRGTSMLVYCLALILSLALMVGGLTRLLMATAPDTIVLPLGLPWIGTHFRADPLSEFFLVIVNLGAAAASLFAIGYGRHEEAPRRVVPFFPAFLAAMNLVVLADDAFTFLMSWEFMSLASWALVMAHHRVPENARAGYVYIVMASAGTLALLLGFGLLAGADGHYTFAAMRAGGTTPLQAALVLALALLGAGSKAGLVPLHVWLPLAHPAAPSHVSALMSGVMTKVAVYGFIRIVFDLLGPPAWWWGVIVVLAGAGTAVLGVLYALMQNDLKRLLAYSTIENIGFIFLGLGLALAFEANGLQGAAALALTAALFHALNHSLFKSLLFFGSGAILTATNERNLEHMGGLIHRMPSTAFACLVGCAAISALPPLNGFASEWLTLQAVLLSPQLPQWALKVFVPAAGGLLALSAALAAACFVRVYGIAFLGRPRTPAAAEACEVDLFMRSAMIALVALCIGAGLVPGLVIDALAPIISMIVGVRMPVQAGRPWLSIVPTEASQNSYDGLLIFGFILVSTLLTIAAIHTAASRSVRRAPAWDCGFPNASPITQYSASSFAQPIRRVFGSYMFRATEHIEMPPPGDLAPARLRVDVHDLVWEVIYARLTRVVEFAADRLNRLQFLTIRRYLGLVFASLVLLLLVLALWP